MTDDSAKPEIDTLYADVVRLREDMSALARTILGLTKKHLGSGLEGADGIDQTIGSVGATLKSTGTEALAGLEKRIVERPVTAILAAFGTGLLLGKLTERS